MTLINVHAKPFVTHLSIALDPLHLNAKKFTSQNEMITCIFVGVCGTKAIQL